MKNLIIIGARGFGREAYNAFMGIHKNDSEWTVKGFLDSQKDILDNYSGYPPIISSPEEYIVQENDYFFCAMGDVRWRKHYVDMMLSKDARFISIISKECKLSKNTVVGNGCFIDDATISCDVSIGNFTFIFSSSVIGHDVKIGNFSHIGSLSFLGGFSRIQNYVTIHPGAQILPHINVENGATVGAGSVVIRSVKENTTVMGIPAKILVFK